MADEADEYKYWWRSVPGYLQSAEEWDPNQEVSAEQQPPPEAGQMSGPAVLQREASGDGTNSVDLPSLDYLAEIMTQLEGPLRDARERLQGVDVRPGGFYHASQIRLKVSGQDADAGLIQSFVTILSNMQEGVVDIRDGLKRLRDEYAKAEREATVSATDVQQLMQEADGDFNLVTQVRT